MRYRIASNFPTHSYVRLLPSRSRGGSSRTSLYTPPQSDLLKRTPELPAQEVRADRGNGVRIFLECARTGTAEYDVRT
jgi:hypothetical protein